MKIEVDVSTEKAKKSLQNLAKETSQSLHAQQSRAQQNFQKHQRQTNANANAKGNSNLLGLAALGTSMVALSKVNDKNTVSINQTVKARDKELRSLEKTKDALVKLSDVINETRRVVNNPDGKFGSEFLPLNLKDYKSERDGVIAMQKSFQEMYGMRLRRIDSLNRTLSFKRGLEKNAGINLLNPDNLTPNQARGLAMRDWMSKKALGLNSYFGRLPLVGGMIGGLGTSMSGAISSIPSSMLGALGAGGSVASALAAPAAAALGGYFAGGKMIEEGRQAQSQRERLNASLGQLQFNMTGTREVSGLTDSIMKLSINGVNSVEDLNSAASALMMSFQGNSKKVKEWLPLIDDVAAATGVSASQMGEMIARVNESGVAESRVINTLSTRGIPIYRELAGVLGVTTQEAKKMAKEGTISASSFEKALQNLGKTVKGTSQALSSMTLEGAEASFKGAESLAFASATEAADRSRIEMLNRLTDETMKEVEDIATQQLRAAAGHGTQAVKNVAYEAWDGISDFFIDLFGGAMVYLGGHSAASSSLNREIQTKIKEMGEVTDDMGADAISAQIEALEKYRKDLKDKMSFNVLGIDFMLDSTREELDKTLKMIDDLVVERARLHREAFERQQAERTEEALRIQKEIEQIEPRLKQEREAKTREKQREMNKTFFDRAIHLDNYEGEGGKVALDFVYRGALASFGMGLTPENVDGKVGELYQSAYENPIIFGNLVSTIEEIKKVSDRYKEVLEDINKKEEERAERLKKEAREREETNLKFAAAMGDKSAEGELAMLEKAYQILDNPYLTDLEKEWWIEEEQNKLIRELQDKTEKGVHLGNDIYGTKEIKTPKTPTEWVTNAWGAACRSFYKFDKGYDEKQYLELKKNTEDNKRIAKGIQTIADRFTISAQ